MLLLLVLLQLLFLSTSLVVLRGKYLWNAPKQRTGQEQVLISVVVVVVVVVVVFVVTISPLRVPNCTTKRLLYAAS